MNKNITKDTHQIRLGGQFQKIQYKESTRTTNTHTELTHGPCSNPYRTKIICAQYKSVNEWSEDRVCFVPYEKTARKYSSARVNIVHFYCNEWKNRRRTNEQQTERYKESDEEEKKVSRNSSGKVRGEKGKKPRANRPAKR